MNAVVSIIIPVFNGANFLEEAIKSALNQTYSKIEIIVVNDGSTDGGETERIALKYKSKIRYFYKENGGVASALNFGIRQMAGEYFSWLSHDDLYLPRKLETQVNLLNKIKLTKPVIAYSDFYEISSNGKITYAVYPPKRYAENSLYLLSNHLINGCSLLIPKVCFEETGYFDESLRSTQDYQLWFRMMNKYRFLYAKGFLVKSRRHEQQGTATIDRHNEAQNKLHIDILDELSLNEIKLAGFKPKEFYLCRSARLKKEGLIEASRYSFNKYLRLLENNGTKRLKIKEFYYNLKYGRRISAIVYFFGLLANPGKWAVLFRIIKGRLL